MCVVSFVGDHYGEKWNPLRPFIPNQTFPYISPQSINFSPTQQEFD